MMRRFSTTVAVRAATAATPASTTSAAAPLPHVPPQLPIFSQRLAASKHNSKMTAMRKMYLDQVHSAERKAAKKEKVAQKAETKERNRNLLSDPLIVGTVLPRRQLKRERVRRFGELPRVPLPGYKPTAAQLAKRQAKQQAKLDREGHGERVIPDVDPARFLPKNELPSYSFNNKRELQRIFARDLRPDNPRLMHLLYLWHATEDFVTPSNLESKLDDFFKNDAAPTTVVETLLTKKDRNLLNVGWQQMTLGRRHAIIKEVGSVEHPNYKVVFDVKNFAEPDRSFVEDQSARATLIGGSLSLHMRLREQVLKDRVTSSVFNKPNVEKVLEWGRTPSVTDYEPKSPE